MKVSETWTGSLFLFRISSVKIRYLLIIERENLLKFVMRVIISPNIFLYGRILFRDIILQNYILVISSQFDICKILYETS